MKYVLIDASTHSKKVVAELKKSNVLDLTDSILNSATHGINNYLNKVLKDSKFDNAALKAVWPNTSKNKTTVVVDLKNGTAMQFAISVTPVKLIDKRV